MGAAVQQGNCLRSHSEWSADAMQVSANRALADVMTGRGFFAVAGSYRCRFRGVNGQHAVSMRSACGQSAGKRVGRARGQMVSLAAVLQRNCLHSCREAKSYGRMFARRDWLVGEDSRKGMSTVIGGLLLVFFTGGCRWRSVFINFFKSQ
jgi:hypothetical protein